MSETIVIVDTHQKKKISSSLRTTDGDIVPLKEITERILKFVKTEIEKEGQPSVVRDQTLPLLTSLLGHFLLKQMGDMTPLITGSPEEMYLITTAATLGFYIYHLMETKKYKIRTMETPVSDAEINRLKQMKTILELSALSKLSGVKSEDFMKGLIKKIEN